MVTRKLVLILALSSGLVFPLFGGTPRGDRLFQEGGGSAGIAGVAGPAGAPGLAGAAGAAGIQGIPGIPGAPGILEYADFYALMPSDNPGTVAVGSAVEFPNAEPTTGAIVALTDSTFLLPTIGTYLVQFQVDVTEAGQLQLRLNGSADATTVVGRATGTTQIVGVSLVTTTTSDTVLEVINPSGNAAALTITPTDGGTQAVSAHLTIMRIQ